MSIMTTFELKAKEASGESLKAFLSDALILTRAYEGCHGARFGVSLESPSSFLIIEEWRSRADFETYLNWRIETGDFAKLVSLLAAEFKVSQFECG